MEGRHRRAGPHEHAHVDALGQLGQQRAGDDRRLAADELEVRGEVPARDVDEIARVLHGLGDLRQRVRAVDQDLERAALARRRIAGRPQAVVGRLERPLPAQAPQAAAVLVRHGGLDRVADGGVGVAHQWYGHHRILPASAPAGASGARGAARPGTDGKRASVGACRDDVPNQSDLSPETGHNSDRLAPYGSSSAARASRGARLRSAGSAPGSARAARSSRAWAAKRSRG